MNGKNILAKTKNVRRDIIKPTTSQRMRARDDVYVVPQTVISDLRQSKGHVTM